MLNSRKITAYAAAGIVATVGLLANEPANAREDRCAAEFDFRAQGKDVSGRVEWRDRRGGLVDVELEARPRLGLADADTVARVRAVNSSGDPVRLRCTFVDGALPGDDDVCEARRTRRGNLSGMDITVRIPGVGRQTQTCIPE
ncbi:MAG: hypothetical protein OEQ18_02200 [Gammaproteobacteria bacterium]|nr:hypothetical protein [Gammaproteobacteria bacterium]